MTINQDVIREVTPYFNKPQVVIDHLFSHKTCFAFKDNPNQEFDLLQDVAQHFQVPYRCIHIIGSAQLGYSFIKDREFQMGKSDLDLAIVNADLFLKYHELCYQVTNRYQDRSLFVSVDEFRRFHEYLALGYFRPDIMPRGKEKTDWLEYFEQLGSKYIDRFKKVTCGIYLGDAFFTGKQQDIINKMMRR